MVKDQYNGYFSLISAKNPLLGACPFTQLYIEYSNFHKALALTATALSININKNSSYFA